jgi:hypothetical protein
MTEEQYEKDEQFAERVAEHRPIYVSHRSRVMAIEALGDMEGDHPQDMNYTLGRWFDAAMKLAKGGLLGCRRCGGWGHNVVTKETCDLCHGTGADPDQTQDEPPPSTLPRS